MIMSQIGQVEVYVFNVQLFRFFSNDTVCSLLSGARLLRHVLKIGCYNPRQFKFCYKICLVMLTTTNSPNMRRKLNR